MATTARSTAHFIEAVRLRHELGDYAGLAECFDGLAENLAAETRDADATMLLAAADQARAAQGPDASLDEVVERVLAFDQVPVPFRAQPN